MKALSMAATGLCKGRGVTVRYEVHRDREPGKNGVERGPVIKEFYGLDRARLAALGYALDGPTATDDRFTGTVRIFQSLRFEHSQPRQSLIDVVDERVASRLLNETRLPRADQLAVSLEALQTGVDALLLG